jgi:hypothetical protein
MFCKDLFKDWLPNHLEGCGWYLECPKDCTPPSKVVLKESHELDFQEKLISFGGLDIQASKKKFSMKRKRKKTSGYC